MRFILHVWSWPHVVFRLVGHARAKSRFSHVELYPLIRYHLVNEMVEERVVSSKVRSNTGLSSSDDLVCMEVDMVMLKENLVLYPIQNTQQKQQTWIYFIHD